MNPKVLIAVSAGITGTITMTMIVLLAPLMGMPKMSPPQMLTDMMGVPVILGWIMHFMIGIVFAFAYVFLIDKLLAKIFNIFLKGMIFGIIAFVFAQVAMAVISMMVKEPSTSSDNVELIIIGSVLGHIMYGIAVVVTAKKMLIRADASLEG